MIIERITARIAWIVEPEPGEEEKTRIVDWSVVTKVRVYGYEILINEHWFSCVCNQTAVKVYEEIKTLWKDYLISEDHKI